MSKYITKNLESLFNQKVKAYIDSNSDRPKNPYDYAYQGASIMMDLVAASADETISTPREGWLVARAVARTDNDTQKIIDSLLLKNKLLTQFMEKVRTVTTKDHYSTLDLVDWKAELTILDKNLKLSGAKL